MAKKPHSMVDSLAEQLSKKTGTTFEVLRGRMRPGHVTMYGLKATRDDVSYQFQAIRPMELDELKRWLASINDMVTMGFIPVAKGGD
jgi:hypothetical protein